MHHISSSVRNSVLAAAVCFAAASAMAQTTENSPILKSPTLPTRRGRPTLGRPFSQRMCKKRQMRWSRLGAQLTISCASLACSSLIGMRLSFPFWPSRGRRY